jgi:hypothetical protein
VETDVFDSIIDPTVGPADGSGAGPFTLAARPDSLSGLRIGLLANIKRNAEQFLDEVGTILTERYGAASVLARKKLDITTTAPEPIMEELRTGADVVVVGVGDCGSCSASAVADGIVLELAGVPAAVVCTDAFTASASAMARVRGVPEYRYLAVPHPMANLTPGGVHDKAEHAVSGIVGMLTSRALAAAS